jgi:hypothetical protein
MADYSIDTTIFGGSPVHGDVTADVTSTLAGLDDMKLTLAGGETATLAGGLTTTLAGENTIHSDATITLQPVTTTSTVNSTSSVDTTSSVDLKPVALDTCVRLELAPPPPTEVTTPYEQQWAWSVLGFELFAITVRGCTSTHVRPEHHGPVLIDR